MAPAAGAVAGELGVSATGDAVAVDVAAPGVYALAVLCAIARWKRLAESAFVVTRRAMMSEADAV